MTIKILHLANGKFFASIVWVPDSYSEPIKTSQTATKMTAKILLNTFSGLRFENLFSTALFAYIFVSTINRDKHVLAPVS